MHILLSSISNISTFIYFDFKVVYELIGRITKGHKDHLNIDLDVYVSYRSLLLKNINISSSSALSCTLKSWAEDLPILWWQTCKLFKWFANDGVHIYLNLQWILPQTMCNIQLTVKFLIKKTITYAIITENQQMPALNSFWRKMLNFLYTQLFNCLIWLNFATT